MRDSSPQTMARIGGVLYLILIAAGVVSQLIRGPMTPGGDAAATAANIAASTQMWRVSIALDLVMHLCDVGLMLVFYVLLRPVSRNLVLLAVLFNLVQTAVLVLNKATLMVPLLLLGNSAYLKAFEPGQLQALSYVAIRFHDYGFGFGLIFFGVECLILGYLIFRSGYLPKFLGVGLCVGGACYLTNSFALILSPGLANSLFPVILLPPLLAETMFALWLVVKGVDLPRWRLRSDPNIRATEVGPLE